MRLYEHPLSSYAQKIKIALREKGVIFTAEVPDSFGTGRSDTPSPPRTRAPRFRFSSTATSRSSNRP